MENFRPFSEQELLQPGGLYYGVNGIFQDKIDTSRMKTELAINLFYPEAVLKIDDIEGEHAALIEALDGKQVTP